MNKKKLHAKCVEAGITLAELCSEIGMSVATFYRRVSKNTLTIGDVLRISNVLKLDASGIISVFFDTYVA